MIRKLVSEFLGTMFLVLFGCGIAVGFTTYMNTLTTVTLPYTLLVIALGFGLSLTAIIYMFGNTSCGSGESNPGRLLNASLCCHWRAPACRFPCCCGMSPV